MKHKAQECLDLLFSKIALRSKCKRKVKNDMLKYHADQQRFNDWFSIEMKLEKNMCNYTLQDLINCQLTVEEMKFAANCLYAAGFVDENMVKQILGKFQKQKEMWVSDDEAN